MIVKANEEPVFSVKCSVCGSPLFSDSDEIYADTCGEPFRTYFCKADRPR